jgi:uncharacterized protein YacL
MSLLLSTMLLVHGGLLSEPVPRAARLLEGQAVTATAAAPVTLEDLTVAQLQAERARTLDSRPSVLWPVTAIAVGAAGLVVGLTAFLFASMVVGGIVMAIAAPVVVLGVVLLLINVPAMKEAGQRVRQIDRLLVLRRQELNAPPPADAPPPPPPPPL